MKSIRLSFLSLVGGVLALSGVAPDARALDKVHVGNPSDIAWAFVPPFVGIEAGIFKKYDLDVDVASFGGDQKMQQALNAGSIDIGLGGGPAMAFSVKGAPVIAVAALFGAPKNISIVVPYDSPIKSPAELKGKLISSSPVGSLTAWLLQRVSLDNGWGTDGIKIAALGGFEPGVAAMRTKQIDGMMSSVEGGLTLEEKKIGRNLTSMEKYAPKFVTHVVFARRDLVASNPKLVDRFLKGLFATIAYMKTHKAETVKVTVAQMHESPAVAEKTYDDEIASFSTDGSFDPAAVAVLKQSFLDMGMLKDKPADNQMYDAQFLPVKP
ncbi:MAG TPA: ABC transporter substrate-binding protein [Stellaceae bacterium]|jgi:ABC-type nitrate/sulfonate/bicarbonate transport system substrate-binding protein|nr:ABC transporter substrate-binding protein [Stellaceae bacterium]